MHNSGFDTFSLHAVFTGELRIHIKKCSVLFLCIKKKKEKSTAVDKQSEMHEYLMNSVFKLVSSGLVEDLQ